MESGGLKATSSAQAFSSAAEDWKASGEERRSQKVAALASSWPDVTPIAELAKVILPGYRGKGLILVLAVYFDESGVHGGSEVVVYSALLGTVEQWVPFETAWKQRLAAPAPGKPPLKRFHMADCEARDKEFKNYSIDERNAIIQSFRNIIVNSGVYGVTATVPITLWDEFITGKRRDKGGSAEHECFRATMTLVMQLITQFIDDKDTALIFDRAPEREDHQKAVIDEVALFYKQNPEAPKLCSTTFCSSYNILPLQAADMIAWESNKYARALLKDAKATLRPQLAELNDTHRFKGAFMKRGDILATAEILDSEL